MGRRRGFDEDAVVETVARLVVERGYDAVSVDDVVRTTGLARGSLYQAYGSKAGLMARMLERQTSGEVAGPGLAELSAVVLASSGARDPLVAERLDACVALLPRPRTALARVLGEALLDRRHPQPR